MPNIVPGALWRPIDVGNRARRVKGRGFIGHVAVSGSTLLVPGPLSTRSADWTFYLPKQPYPTGERFAQLIDLDLQCWSSGAGNTTCPAFESQGGLGNTAEVNAEPWTGNQVESAAIILAHLHATEGTPLQDMGNSLARSRGFGVHRYGIDPWRVAGGEVWSSSRGKLCPGDAKVRQIPAIVARAQEIANGDDDMPLSDEDVTKIMNWPFGPFLGEENLSFGQFLKKIPDFLQNATGGDLRLLLQRQAEQQAEIDELAGRVAAPAVKVNVDAAAVAAALAGNQQFLTAIAKVVADENARRQAS